MFTKTRFFLSVATILFAVTGTTGASAAPADDAKTHFQAIGTADLTVLMHGYADQAQFNWVGGPLDATPEAIRGV